MKENVNVIETEVIYKHGQAIQQNLAGSLGFECS